MPPESNDGHVYSIDSCSLIAAFTQHYRPSHFKSFWNQLDNLVEAGRLIASEEVRREIERKEDGLKEWAKERPQMFVGIDEEQQEIVREIVNDYPYMTKDFMARNRADVWVIALAKCREGRVVTEEPMGSSTRPRIPFVCQGMGIEHDTLMDLIEAEGWEF